MKLRYILLPLMISLTGQRASSDDFYRAVKGPTTFQTDARTVYSSSTNQSLNTLVLKYWPESIPIIMFGSQGYKISQVSNGATDFTIGAGPRIRLDQINIFPYLGLTLPTGNNATSNHRTDFRQGIATTILTDDDQWQLNALLENDITGKVNQKDIPDEIYYSVLPGVKIDKTILGVGITGTEKKDSHLLNIRVPVRYIFSKYFHLEGYLEGSVKNKNAQQNRSIGLYARYNF